MAINDKLTTSDFKRAKEALEKARIKEPLVLTSRGIESLEDYEKRRLAEGREI